MFILSMSGDMGILGREKQGKCSKRCQFGNKKLKINIEPGLQHI